MFQNVITTAFLIKYLVNPESGGQNLDDADISGYFITNLSIKKAILENIRKF
jgi:hypothetical protein